ncbi:putative inositol monophosphatase 3 [Drosophila albomicans]|uniref:Putative inositol monophosphatase 3 n=1 Tax=Drosophila albomicans TaxID=7291 RepID=A0A6P8XY76_DROAB|nr:putative inositol monophosphatase 3 [Drosophila albomicans]XP_034118314.1 putative inositol monophosphatase 3 [Drosophila albomicans]
MIPMKERKDRKEIMNGRTIRINRVPATITAILLTIVLVYFLNFHQEERPSIYGMLRSDNKVNLRKMLIAAIQAAQRGGLEIVDVANSRQLKERSKGKTAEGVNDPFTDADGRSHCVMKQGLKRIFPRVHIFSEEDKEHCQDAHSFDLDPTVLHETAIVPDVAVTAQDVTVWVDPLDATKEFTEELYEYVTTMVCVAVAGQPVIGVIHNPFSGHTAWAWVGHSMSEYLAELHKLPRADKGSDPIITISRSHTAAAQDVTRAVFGQNVNILTAAGAGYKVLQVVANNATAYLHTSIIKKWDICAGDAILRALGGAMTTLNDESINYGPNESPVNKDGLLASLTHHGDYMERVSKYRAQHNGKLR